MSETADPHGDAEKGGGGDLRNGDRHPDRRANANAVERGAEDPRGQTLCRVDPSSRTKAIHVRLSSPPANSKTLSNALTGSQGFLSQHCFSERRPVPTTE